MASPNGSKKSPSKRHAKTVKSPAAVKKVVDKKPATRGPQKAKLLSSKLAYKGNVFSVYTDHVQEPGGGKNYRDVVRHNGSVVILAVDDSHNPKDPMVVMERQYRHAAGQFLLELPAGKMDKGETALAGAKREMIEETGYRASKWKKLVRYYASPGFLGEWMEIYLATGIKAGEAEPEEDERIEVSLVPLSKLVEMIHAGKIHDGKTIIGVLLYAGLLRN
jgi:ADP-ribose pyrophosphatase